ncbi:MAG: hypothetical protein WDZ90_00755 [Candidatus Paceibacterota bacterium]
MGSLRTIEDEQRYLEYQKTGGLDGECLFCREKGVKEFTYWKVLPNTFPYNKIAKVHDMLAPKRHVTEQELPAEELEEYQALKAGFINTNYEFIFEPTQKKKSIPKHFHLHLIEAKDSPTKG